MSADTHPCKELFGVLCSLNTLPSLTLNLSLLIYFHTLSLYLQEAAVLEKKKTWLQFRFQVKCRGAVTEMKGHAPARHT